MTNTTTGVVFITEMFKEIIKARFFAIIDFIIIKNF